MKKSVFISARYKTPNWTNCVIICDSRVEQLWIIKYKANLQKHWNNNKNLQSISHFKDYLNTKDWKNGSEIKQSSTLLVVTRMYNCAALKNLKHVRGNEKDEAFIRIDIPLYQSNWAPSICGKYSCYVYLAFSVLQLNSTGSCSITSR